MARRRPIKGTLQQCPLLIIHSYAAGIDIGARFHVVAVPSELAPEPVRPLQSFTEDVHRMPAQGLATLRAYLRHRERLLEYAAASCGVGYHRGDGDENRARDRGWQP